MLTKDFRNHSERQTIPSQPQVDTDAQEKVDPLASTAVPNFTTPVQLVCYKKDLGTILKPVIQSTTLIQKAYAADLKSEKLLTKYIPLLFMGNYLVCLMCPEAIPVLAVIIVCAFILASRNQRESTAVAIVIRENRPTLNILSEHKIISSANAAVSLNDKSHLLKSLKKVQAEADTYLANMSYASDILQRLISPQAKDLVLDYARIDLGFFAENILKQELDDHKLASLTEETIPPLPDLR